MTNYTAVDINRAVLEHHGIRGQKWGVRRYQNPDGTLTAAGRKRYGEDLDINDKSRQNIAKIRTGEAQRRLDVAKSNREKNNNDYRVAELQGRLRSAKRNEKNVKKMDKGAKLASKGQTIRGNNTKIAVAAGAAYLSSKGLTYFLNSRLDSLGNIGKLTTSHMKVAQMINTAGTVAVYTGALAYNIKKNSDNSALRIYNNAKFTGDSTIKKIGSTEYSDVVKRRKG